MSYQAFARKYRPKSFAELVGQQHVVSAISNGLSNSRVHHAYLFSGTRGVGKTTIARIFAKSLNCEEGTSAHPCGSCTSCVDIDMGRYVDLLEIDAASRTKVEDTRELLDNVQYRPTRGRYKVYLIDEVHMLSKHSFNALLKTLEEPPEHVKFLLATTDPQKLPITVLSRCLQFNLKALTVDQIEQQLTHVLREDNIEFEPAALSALAKSARGSMRDALSLLDQAVASGNNQVSMTVVKDMLGLVDHSVSIQLFRRICARDKAAAFELLHAMYHESLTLESILDDLIAVCYQVALTQMVPEVCKLETEHARGIFELAKQLTAEHVQLLYQIGLQGKKDFAHAPDPKVGLEMTVLRMLAFAPQQHKAYVSNPDTNDQSISKKNTELSQQTETAVDNDGEPAKSPKEQPEQDQRHRYNQVTDNDNAVQAAPYDVNKDEQFKRTVAAISLRGKLARPKAVPKQDALTTDATAINDLTDTPAASDGMTISDQASNDTEATTPSWSEQPFFDEEHSNEGHSSDERSNDDSFGEQSLSEHPPNEQPLSEQTLSEQTQSEQLLNHQSANERPPCAEPEIHSSSMQQACSGLGDERGQRLGQIAALFGTTSLSARLAQLSSVDALEPEQTGLQRVIKKAADVDPWCALIESMKPVGKLRNLLMNSVPVDFNEGVLRLLTADEQDSLLDDRLRADACAALQSAGVDVAALNIEFAEDPVTPLILDSHIKQLLIERAQLQFDRDPKLSCLKQQFGAQVIADTLVIK